MEGNSDYLTLWTHYESRGSDDKNGMISTASLLISFSGALLVLDRALELMLGRSSTWTLETADAAPRALNGGAAVRADRPALTVMSADRVPYSTPYCERAPRPARYKEPSASDSRNDFSLQSPIRR